MEEVVFEEKQSDDVSVHNDERVECESENDAQSRRAGSKIESSEEKANNEERKRSQNDDGESLGHERISAFVCRSELVMNLRFVRSNICSCKNLGILTG